MHDLPRQKLRELILQYGRPLCEDWRRCEALLKDYCGQYKREVFVLVNAQKNHIPDELQKISAGIPLSLMIARLSKRLEDELAFTPDAAQWTVESWALALNIITQPLPPAAPIVAVATPPKKPAPAPQPPASPPPLSIPTVQPVIQQPSPSTGSSGYAYPSELSSKSRYRDQGDGTVLDLRTGLQWMRCALGQKWRDGKCLGEARLYSWPAALTAIEVLNRRGGFARYRDWRLPAVDELKTLIYCSSGRPQTWNLTGKPCSGEHSRPTIDLTAFPNTPAVWFWSSSTGAYDSASAWYVDFSYGYVDSYDKNYGYAVRLVRNSGQAPT